MALKLPVDGNESDGAQASGEKNLMKSELFTVIGVRRPRCHLLVGAVT